MNWNPFQRKPKSSGTKLPAFLPILEEMARQWEAVSLEDIDRCNLHLTPIAKDDTKLGVIHSLEARRTFALAGQMMTRCAEARLHAQSKAESKEESRFYLEQAERFDALYDCLKELFFAQAKDDIGGEAWGRMDVGIRAGWMLVKVKERGGMPQFVEFLGGGFRPTKGD